MLKKSIVSGTCAVFKVEDEEDLDDVLLKNFTFLKYDKTDNFSQMSRTRRFIFTAKCCTTFYGRRFGHFKQLLQIPDTNSYHRIRLEQASN